jgi:hypothetical protein
MLQTKPKNPFWQAGWGYEIQHKYDNDSNYKKVLQPIYLLTKYYHKTIFLSTKFSANLLIFLKIYSICLNFT